MLKMYKLSYIIIQPIVIEKIIISKNSKESMKKILSINKNKMTKLMKYKIKNKKILIKIKIYKILN